MNNQKIYLASQSPRRRELLAQVGLECEIITIDVPEIPEMNETPEMFVKRMALTKARAGWHNEQRQRDFPVLGADTIVTIDQQILGKPRDKKEGIQMLSQLAGKTHQVFSAVAVVKAEQEMFAVSKSSVTFSALTLETIKAYWETGESCDKAGGYAVQGKAAVFIKEIIGSYSGIMGLPLFETAQLLKQFGITVLT